MRDVRRGNCAGKGGRVEGILRSQLGLERAALRPVASHEKPCCAVLAMELAECPSQNRKSVPWLERSHESYGERFGRALEERRLIRPESVGVDPIRNYMHPAPGVRELAQILRDGARDHHD